MKRGISVVGVVCLGLMVGGEWFAAAAVGADRLADDLAAQVTIRRDTYGVPHILGKTEEAAALGHGYASAEDYVLDMARLYLKARAEEAAYFGEKFAESDFLVKQLRMYEGAKTGYGKLAPWVRRILDGYARGYNRYVEQHRGELPEWVRPIEGIDVLAHLRRVVIMEFSMNLRQVEKIGKPETEVAAVSEPEPILGSNMWAIGPKRSASGKALLLGNPHLAWAGSQIFYEAHLTVPGKVNISGTSLVGTPGVAIGFNENLGWSHTVNDRDPDDVYELTPDPANPAAYVYDGRSVPLEKEAVSIQVKTDGGLETRTRNAYWSHYGPVLKRHGGKLYAFKSANQDEYRFVEQWNLMGKARNLQEFRNVLDMQAVPMFNICYADREGNIFYLFNGRCPDRPQGMKWSGVVPGNTSATEWCRILPQGRLPCLVNPAGDYVQNCNSSPWYTTLRQAIDRKKFPEDLTTNVNTLRQQLSLEMLEANGKMSLEEMKRLKFNTKILLADRVKDDLVQMATVSGQSEAARVLKAWDNTVSRTAKGAVLFVSFWEKYHKKAKPVFAVAWDETRPVATPYGLGDEQAALKALGEAVAEVTKKCGAVDVAWGDVYRLRRGSVDLPVSGLTTDYGAFRVVGYEEDKDGKFAARGGDSYVMAVEFTSPPTAYSVVAYSQSNDPKSPHFADQTRLFADEKWKRAWFTEEDIARNLERSYRP